MQPTARMRLISPTLTIGIITLLNFISETQIELELDVVYTNNPRENLNGNVEVVVEFFVWINWINWVWIWIWVWVWIRRIAWCWVSKFTDLIYTEFVNIVTNNSKLHYTHLIIMTIIIVTVPIIIVCIVITLIIS